MLAILVLPNQFAAAAAAQMPEASTTHLERSTAVDQKKTKKAGKISRWLAKIKAKGLEKSLKWQRKLPALNIDNYLVLCLLLLLASILFFALNTATGVPWLFNAFGSLAGIAAMVFFVLWLLDYTGNL